MVGGAATHSHDLALELAHEHALELAHELAPAPVSAPARVGAGKYVTINYTLRTNGAIRHIRSAVWGDEPLEYLHGSGRLLPALERALEGKVEGERFVATLPPEEAYGERDKALQQRVPAEQFGGVGPSRSGDVFSRAQRGRPPRGERDDHRGQRRERLRGGRYQSPTRRDDARVRRHCGGRTRCPGDSGMRQGIGNKV